MPGRARLAGGGLSEDAFSGQVAGLAAFYGWRGYHTHRSDRSAPGFPDWTFVRGPELLFVELKPDKGSRRATVAAVEARPDWLRHADLSDAQAEWLKDLARVAEAVERAASTALGEGTLDAGDYIEGPRPDATRLAVEVHVWRPRDWPTIERRLAAGRHLHPSVNRP